MGRNTRGIPARKPIEIGAKQASALIAEYGLNIRSCKVRKFGLHKVVDTLAANDGSARLIARILNDKDGTYKADIGETPVRRHVAKRCSCFMADGTARKNGG